MKTERVFKFSTVFSQNMEGAIVAAWNNENMDKYEKQKDMAIETVNYLKKKGVAGKAIHLTQKYSTSDKWKEYKGETISHSKTDIKIGDTKISIKTGKKSQLTSVSKKDATALFLSVADTINSKEIVDTILSKIENFVSGIATDTVSKAKKYDESLKKGDVLHKELQKMLINIFNNNTRFRNAIIYEAITGKIKFGEKNDASANYLLSVKAEKPELKYIDYSLANKLAKNVKFGVTFKSDSGKGKNINNYYYRSVIRLMLNKTSEELIYNNNQLNESLLNFFKDLLNKIRSFLLSNIDNIFKFLDIEPVLTIEGDF